MNCTQVREKLYDLIFGLLDDAEAQQAERHLQSCPDCRREREKAGREVALLHRWTAPKPPEGLAAAAIAKARSAAQAAAIRPVEPELRWLRSRWFWSIAASILILLALGFGVHTWRVLERHASTQEAFLYGQWNLTPGTTGAYRVYVRNGMTAAPVPNARVRVQLASLDGRPLWTVKAATGDDGMAQIEAAVPADAKEGQYRLKVIADSGEGESEVAQDVTVKRSFRVMVSTDKPVYQPGQVIHVRTLSLATADLRPVAGREALVEIKDAKGNKVFKKRLQTSDYSIASADFELADQVNMGSYTVSATVGDTTSERSVNVERYVLPKFSIAVTTDQGFYQPDAVVKGDLSAQYTFGKPVAGGKVKVVASEFIETFRPFATAEGRTDAEGRYHFEIPLKGWFVGQELRKGDAFVALEATVTDTADHAEKKSLDLPVSDSPIRIELFPEGGRLVQGIENILYIVTMYPDGRPAKTKLAIGATREAAETSALGIAKVKITPESAAMQLTVLAEDERGVKAQTTQPLRIDERTDGFLVRTDRAVYQTGGTVKILLLSTEKTGRVFLDVVKDRRTVLMQALDVKDGQASAALDLPHDLFGTLELHAYRILRDGNILSDARVIQVLRAEDLRVTAELDKETYRPGEKALLKFLVARASGEPAQAALGLAGVDEAVFALQDMRPGLEQVYFAIQEEILKPRYQIQAELPVTPQQIVAPEQKPELEEAKVVLFSAAKGAGDVAVTAGEPFAQRNQRYEAEREEYKGKLADEAVAIPLLLMAVFSLPTLLYVPLKLFYRRRPEGDAESLRLLEGAVDYVRTWWALAVFLPPVSWVVGAFVLRLVGGPLSEPWYGMVVALGLIVLMLFVWLLRRELAALVRALEKPPRGIAVLTHWIPWVFIACVMVGAVLFDMEGMPELHDARELLPVTTVGFLAVPLAIVLLGLLTRAVVRFRRLPISRAMPLLRLAVLPLPVLALFLIGCGVWWFVAGIAQSGPSSVLPWILVLVIGLIVLAALSMARKSVRGGKGMSVWTPFLVLLALALFGGLFLPPLSAAREAGRIAPRRGELGGRNMQVGAGLARPETFTAPAPAMPTSEGGGFAKSAGDWEERPPAERPPAEPLKAPARIRSYFPETLLWQPQLITDALGRAQLEVPLADSITTWRIAMSAVSQRGEMGAAEKSLRAFQDFFVDIDFPVRLTQHDRVSVPVAVYNYLDAPQTVRLQTLLPDSWCELLSGAEQTLTIGPHEVRAAYLPLEAKTPGLHSLTVKAYGTAMADAVQRTVLVEPDGRAVTQTINGQLAPALSHEIVIPESAIEGASDWLVKIYPGAFSQVVEGLDNIFQMPNGCFEQTSSTTYPNILALDYLRRTKQTKPEVELKALNYIALGWQRLLSFEVKGGGFEWFGHEPANVGLTAYGLMEFSDMAKVFEVDAAVISRTRDWLVSKQKDNGSWEPMQGIFHENIGGVMGGNAVLTTTAYVAWALADSGLKDAALDRAMNYLAAKAGSLDDAYALALCANALVAADRTEALAAMQRLEGMKHEDEKTVHWSSKSEGMTYSRGDCLDVETTALAAQAFLKSGHRPDLARKALAWLISRKDSAGTWFSTQATVQAMRALLAGADHTGSVEADTSVSIIANGTPAAELKITPDTSDVFRLVSLRPYVREGKNTLSIRTQGKGSLAYQVVATHYEPWSEATAAPAKEVAIDVQYDAQELKVNDILTSRVTVRYNGPGTASMTIVDLGIPPGFEVLSESLQALKEKGLIEQFSVTGRQVILYFRQLAAGRPVSFTWQLRAKFPVRAKTPAAVIYQYYQPEVRAVAKPVVVTVM